LFSSIKKYQHYLTLQRTEFEYSTCANRTDAFLMAFVKKKIILLMFPRTRQVALDEIWSSVRWSAN